MDSGQDSQIVELRVSYRYVHEHPWVTQAVTGFLSAYFMEHPGFRVQRHWHELESGMQVWACDVPAGMKMRTLLKRLQADIPACRYVQLPTEPHLAPRYLIDCPEPKSPNP